MAELAPVLRAVGSQELGVVIAMPAKPEGVRTTLEALGRALAHQS